MTFYVLVNDILAPGSDRILFLDIISLRLAASPLQRLSAPGLQNLYIQKSLACKYSQKACFEQIDGTGMYHFVRCVVLILKAKYHWAREFASYKGL